MRIKTLLCAASVAALAAPAMAQNVYSLNIVGYVNMPITEGLNLVATPLDADGTGTNNYSTNLFGTILPVNTTIFTYNGAGYASVKYTYNAISKKTNWAGGLSINPGRGYWVQVPAGTLGGGTQMITSVGTVLQGPLVNQYLPAGAGLGLLGNMVPIAGDLVTNFNYVPNVNDTVFIYNGSGYASTKYTYNAISKKTNWASRPNIGIAQGFWLQCAQPGSTWSNNFVPTP